MTDFYLHVLSQKLVYARHVKNTLDFRNSVSWAIYGRISCLVWLIFVIVTQWKKNRNAQMSLTRFSAYSALTHSLSIYDDELWRLCSRC